MGDGVSFELEGSREDFEECDLYGELDDEDVPDEAIKPNPCKNKFFEMKGQMTQVSNYLCKKVGE